MIDIKLLQTKSKYVSEQLKKRGFYLDESKFNHLDSRKKNIENEITDLYIKRKNQTKNLVSMKKIGENVDDEILELSFLSQKIKDQNNKLVLVKKEIFDFISLIPNIPLFEVPLGKSSKENIEIYKWGKIKKNHSLTRDHKDIMQMSSSLDFNIGSKLAGTRFSVIEGKIAAMHRALINFMIDTHVNQNGYKELYVPYLANKSCLFGTGQLPKFSEDLFNIGNGSEYSLIPTGEVPLTNLVREKILDSYVLPLKFVAHTSCFRREAGSYGKDSKGLIRQHQFEKVELVGIVHPDESMSFFEEMMNNIQVILRKLDLPYRIVQLCTGDLGFSSCKTNDVEVWIPSKKKYLEVSSCSLCGDFQARRMYARFRDSETQSVKMLNTLNGSGLAVGRTLVAVLENYQQVDGSILVPEVLKKYLNYEYI